MLSEILHRPNRAVTLAAGILAAAVSFTLLTSAVATSQLQVLGTIRRSFRPAYDVLVRPGASFTDLEQRAGLVQANYLSGIFGGITFGQYRQVKRVPGVEVAAPIANVGYILPFQPVPVEIDRFLSDAPTQIYRLRVRWLANGGVSRYPDSPQYVYFTRRDRFRRTGNGLLNEILPGGREVRVCLPFIRSLEANVLTGDPFSLAAGTSLSCFSERTPGLRWSFLGGRSFPRNHVGAGVDVYFPILIAAIDPAQEYRLVDLPRAVVRGRPLRPDDRVGIERAGANARYRSVPILVSTRTYLDERLRIDVERLRPPPERELHRALSSDERAYPFLVGLRGRTVGSLEVPAQSLYDDLLATLTERKPQRRITYDTYWTASPVRYRREGDALVALATKNPQDVFRATGYGAGWAPLENRDTQFRRLQAHPGGGVFVAGVYPVPTFRVVGYFDPQRLPGFDPLSEVPLETYYPPRAEPADPWTREVLGGRPLLPTMNLGGYVSQPPLILTNLRGLRAFTNAFLFAGANEEAPISAIRVRVAGVTGPDPLSRERIRRVAELIHRRTGLAVDITAGSSPRPMLIRLPAGGFGQPPLTVREAWVEKGVAIRFLEALDRKSLTLLLLVLAVCAAFLANGALAAVRARRREIGTLLCLGWSRTAIFAAILSELALIGFAAGIVGTGLAGVLARSLALRLSVPHTFLVAPVSVGLALAAGSLPALRAARSVPLDAVLPPARRDRRGRTVARLWSMALRNARGSPSRILVAAFGLFLGVGAVSLLLAVNLAFQGVLVGTLLGGVISLQVRGMDLASALLTVALGALSVGDVLFLNVRERAPELVALRATGWGDGHLVRLVAAEGATIGLLGAVPGAVAGGAATAAVGGFDGRVVVGALGGVMVGVAVTVVASLVPAALVGRLTPPSILAEE